MIATKLGWKPAHVFTNSVSATTTFLGIAAKSGSDDHERDDQRQLPARPDRTRPTTTQPGMKLYRQIMAKYDPKGNVNDQLNVYGMAKAWNDRAGLEGRRARTSHGPA